MNPLRKLILICGIGSVLEWYDFSLYGSLAPIIAHHFFHAKSEANALLMAFATFGIGFLIRPLGALYFGKMGDLRGRKIALIHTVFAMSLASAAIGIIPTYSKVGIAAPIALVLLRLIQGFSASGEYPNAVSLITEMSPADRKGFFASFSLMGIMGGILLGSITTTIVSHFSNTQFMNNYGWRIPFLISAPLGLFGLYCRKKISESYVFQSLINPRAIKRNFFRSAFKENKTALIFAFTLFLFGNAVAYLIFIYTPAYLSGFHHLDFYSASLCTSLSLAALIVLLPYTGKLSDKYGRSEVMLIGALGILLTSYFLFKVMSEPSWVIVFLAQFLLATQASLFMGPMIAHVSELFPANFRVTGIGVSVNLAASLFGGTAPFLANFLVRLTGNPFSASYYIMFCALVVIISMLHFSNKCQIYNE